MSTDDTSARDAEIRELAIKQLKKRRDFRGHVLLYILVNAFLVVIWALTMPGEFFWPVFPMVGWGIFVALNAWDVYGRPITDEDIEHEVEHMRHHPPSAAA